jgi:hypothetical protein
MASQLENLVGGSLPPANAPEATPQAEQPQTETVEEIPATAEEVVEEAVQEETPVEEQTPEQTPPAKTPDIPKAVAIGWKHDLRDVRNENIQLRERLAVVESRLSQVAEPKAEAPSVEEDPIIAYQKAHAEEYGGDLDSVPIPGKVILERDHWKERRGEVAQQQTVAQKAQSALKAAETVITDQALGPGMGMEAVVTSAKGFLTQDDYAAVRKAGDNAPIILYERCMQHLWYSGVPELQAKAKSFYAMRAGVANRQPATTAAVPKPKQAADTAQPPQKPAPVPLKTEFPTMSRLGLLDKAEE